MQSIEHRAVCRHHPLYIKSSVIKILQVKSAINTLSKMKDSINIMKQACPNVGP